MPPENTPISSFASLADLTHLAARCTTQALIVLDNTHTTPNPVTLPAGEEVFEHLNSDKLELVSKTLGLDVSVEKKQKNFVG